MSPSRTVKTSLPAPPWSSHHSLLQAWLDSSQTAIEQRQATLKDTRRRLTMLEGESANVIKLVRAGICSPDDPQVASELATITAQKKTLAAEIELLVARLADGGRTITPQVLDRFGALLSAKLKATDDVVLRGAYVRLLVDRVEIGRQCIRINGGRNAPARAATAKKGVVPKAEREWRTRQDSNL